MPCRLFSPGIHVEALSHNGSERLPTAEMSDPREDSRMDNMTLGPGHKSLRRGRCSIPGQIYAVTFTTAHRVPWFADFETARVAAGTLVSSMRTTDAEMLAWVLMPDHAHVLLALGARWSLQKTVQRLKWGTANAVNRTAGRRGILWARAFHDHALRTDEDVRSVARYIVLNPVRAGLVARCGDYSFWDAVWISRPLR